MKYKRTYEVRQFTNIAYDLIDEGILNKDLLIQCCLKYMSEDDVKDMLECNEIIEIED